MKKKVAVIGYGGMGQWHAAHLSGEFYQNENVSPSDVAELWGVYDIDEAKMEKARSKGVRTYASQEELLSDKNIDIVLIATPNDVHEPIAVAAMNAKKSVISEKPVTMGIESLERMIAAAEKNNVKFTVHQNRRFDGYFVGMKNIAESGAVGDVISMESRVHGPNGIPGDWRKQKAHGGGMLYDWGVHMIDQLLYMNGYDVDRVYCTLDYLTGCDCDDGCFVEIYLKSGIRLHVEICTFNFISLPLMYMRGTAGTAMVRSWTDDIEVTRCTKWKDEELVPVRIGAGLSKTMAPRSHNSVIREKIEQPDTDVHDFYRNFCRAIDGIEEQLVTHDQMRCVIKVIDAAFKSSESGEVVKL